MNRRISAITALLMLLTTAAAPASGGERRADPKAQWPARGAIVRLPAIPWPNWKPGHRGIDIEVPLDSVVVSPVNGRVVWVGVVADEPSISVLADGLKHTLTPVVSTLLKGDWVGRADPLGTVAASQHCNHRICVHWSIRRGTSYLDPRWVAQPLLRRGSPR